MSPEELVTKWLPRSGFRPNSRATFIDQPQPNDFGVDSLGSSGFHQRSLNRGWVSCASRGDAKETAGRLGPFDVTTRAYASLQRC